MISFDSVGVRVPTWTSQGRQSAKTLLTDVSAELSDRLVSVIGANGSGKSTLLRLVNGLAGPTTGRVLVNGVDVAADTRAVRRQVGLVFTDPLSQLVASTPLDDLELSLRRLVRRPADRTERAMQLLADRGLADLARQSIYDLSGGERQLVALTTVLAVEPAIVVADEPTTLLDLRNRDVICEALLSLDQQVLYATHDLDFAAAADRTLVIDQGRLVYDGVPGDAVVHYVDLMRST